MFSSFYRTSTNNPIWTNWNNKLIRSISSFRLRKMAELPETFEGISPLRLSPCPHQKNIPLPLILFTPSNYSPGPLHIAIIGGTGLTSLPSFKPVAQLPLTHASLQTPWGAPSSPITILSHARAGALRPLNVAFLSRHGLHHEIPPHQVNSRANVAALRKLGVRCVLAFSAVGSLREEVKPRDFLVPDQVIDRSKGVSATHLLQGSGLAR